MARLPEVSHEMQLSSSQENSSFNGGNSRSSEICRNIGSTSPRVDISVEQNSPFYGTVVLLHCGCLSLNPFIEISIRNNSSSSDVLNIQASISISPKFESK